MLWYSPSNNKKSIYLKLPNWSHLKTWTKRNIALRVSLILCEDRTVEINQCGWKWVNWNLSYKTSVIGLQGCLGEWCSRSRDGYIEQRLVLVCSLKARVYQHWLQWDKCPWSSAHLTCCVMNECDEHHTEGDVDVCRCALVKRLFGKARYGLIFCIVSLRSTLETWYFLVVKPAWSCSAL